jgi:hypothetical protein
MKELACFTSNFCHKYKVEMAELVLGTRLRFWSEKGVGLGP